ncbi:hypothetical protein K7W42_04470 [Deinococcus sp. HMF7604]|uniref:hypothetical protein n=1 Tax=Deinococcus betulae TaxID=2873312 RepID=UPI001CC93426|nr:hypothetical protein [Deinococcus betulae]MBZ9750114.1 hypothetical protein [Deinococcus betulae]
MTLTLPPSQSPHLQLYIQAATTDHWAEATALLAQAYQAAPPQTLSSEDCRILLPLTDALTYLGQHLPCLSPTLALLHRLIQLRPAA